MGVRVSVSSRRDRVTILPYEGANDGGFATPSYGAARGTFWCRISPIPGDEQTISAQSEHTERAVFEFADEVTVNANDILVTADGKQWKVESPTPRKVNRQIIVRAFRTDEAAVLET